MPSAAVRALEITFKASSRGECSVPPGAGVEASAGSDGFASALALAATSVSHSRTPANAMQCANVLVISSFSAFVVVSIGRIASGKDMVRIRAARHVDDPKRAVCGKNVNRVMQFRGHARRCDRQTVLLVSLGPTDARKSLPSRTLALIRRSLGRSRTSTIRWSTQTPARYSTTSCRRSAGHSPSAAKSRSIAYNPRRSPLA